MNGHADLRENIVQDSAGPQGRHQLVSQAAHSAGLSEKGRLCPADNCMDYEFGENGLQ